MFPVLVAAFLSLLLRVPSCSAGDPCPTKMELGNTCTCNYVRITREFTSTLPTPSLVQMEEERNMLTPNTTVSPPTRKEKDGGIMYTEVICNKARTLTELEETALTALHRKLIDKLIVSQVPSVKEHTLVNLPVRWLRNTRIRQLEIRDTLLAGDFISQGIPLDGQADTMLWLSAYRCNLFGALTYEDLGTVNTRGLNQLPHLEGVDLSFNHLTVIRATAFRVPPANLSTILLPNNSITVIESASFQYIPMLKCIDLSHNLLNSVARAMFASPARYLENINLSWNYLRVLPADFFVNMPSLKIVSLNKNFLYTMPGQPWAVVFKQLTFLDLTGNFIDCDCNLLWLLPILSPAAANATSTPAPKPLPGQDIRGSCSQNTQMPGHYAIEHRLTTLTRKDLMC
ncbi:uncharacterized protein CDAR_178521 [Caerostris darwini]|uniref:Uncharacterized protein n=1 Tax=Caerostris darwini TaxID=1538125 RepID=A0AAV4PDC1_9ARAC|nr:uncharacterized protein CDAR_178521 [Caerostris darwini]